MVGEQLIDIVHIDFVHVLDHFDAERLAQVLVGGDFYNTAVGGTNVHEVGGGFKILEAELGAQETCAVLEDLCGG